LGICVIAIVSLAAQTAQCISTDQLTLYYPKTGDVVVVLADGDTRTASRLNVPLVQTAVREDRLLVTSGDLSGWCQRTDVLSNDEAAPFFDTLLRDIPNDLWGHRRRAMLYLDSRQPAEALKHIDSLLKGEPKTAAHHFLQGAAQIQMGSVKAGIASIEKSIAIDPSVQRFLDCATIWFILGDTNKSIADIQRAKKIDPKNWKPYLLLGAVEMSTKNYDLALKSLDEAAKIKPDDYRIFKARAIVRLMQNNLKTSIADCNTAVRLSPEAADAYHVRSSVNLRSGNSVEALKDLDTAIGLDAKDTGQFVSRGILNAMRGANDLAMEDFNHAVRLNDAWPATWYWRGKLRRDLDQLADALTDLTEAVRLLRETTPSINIQNQMRAFWRQPDLLQAARPQHQPSLSDCLLARAQVRHSLKDSKGTIEDTTEVLQLSPRTAIAYSLRGLALCRMQKLEEARQDLNQAVLLDPTNEKMYFNRSVGFSLSGMIREGRQDVERGLELQESNAKRGPK